jgi:hypothetical protein
VDEAPLGALDEVFAALPVNVLVQRTTLGLARPPQGALGLSPSLFLSIYSSGITVYLQLSDFIANDGFPWTRRLLVPSTRSSPLFQSMSLYSARRSGLTRLGLSPSLFLSIYSSGITVYLQLSDFIANDAVEAHIFLKSITRSMSKLSTLTPLSRFAWMRLTTSYMR